ncbi:DUF309 domain-containing protein [Gloeocapsopsis sp. IPPAS B-1203]|uniref:DUF309 domain-containing protein n=1 Tax=Gloeocapsopsis sp. IPPAS B-1203 TaxID=2049454 RepID=UPI000C18C960|nr:DUF309 domain-containing protein [Gloeocapsopsis sp. IPPAS B-1203]PIG90730.1 hypothetical protein CSQ79_24890 [Gloeocapsopsis sp. IPPAS B-1203]
MNESIPDEFWQSVEQFNTRQFYACHDTLEALWMEASDPEKTFYQGILQLAVALYHLGNSNWRGAVILLGEGTNKLQRYSPTFGGIDVEELIDSSCQLLTQLQQAGPEKVHEWIVQKEVNENSDLLPIITIAQSE